MQDRLSSLPEALGGHPFVTKVVYRPRLDSTNNLAKRYANEGLPEGLLVIAEEQTAGRGRMGRLWWAPAGSALLTSLLFRPSTPSPRPIASSAEFAQLSAPHLAQQLTMLCALAAADAIADLTRLPVDLKWPNDLNIRGQKLAGLLAEAIFSGDRIDAVIVGLGINVNMDLTDAPSFRTAATSLKRELGQPVDRFSLLLAYLDRVAYRYDRFKQRLSPFDEWSSRLATIGQHVTAYLAGPIAPSEGLDTGRPTDPLVGLAQGVDTDGALLLCTADGIVHRLLAADVSLTE